MRFFVAVLALFFLTACSHTESTLMGDPREPYPLQTPPKVGDITHLPTGILVTMPQMLSVAGDARIVYVGETHDNPASHRLELEVLKGLADLHPGRQTLGMEMFSRSQQEVLDKWVAGKLTEKEFLKESRWYDNWRMDFAHYRDLLNFARDRHIPVIALNAEKSLVAAIRNKPAEELTAEERKQLPEMDMTDPYQRAMVEGIFSGHVHAGMQIEGFVRAQTLWDETMAESVARYLSRPAGKDKHLLVVAGGNHVSYGFGIPRRAFRRLPASYTIIGGQELAVPEEKKAELMNVTIPPFPMVPYDFLVYFNYEVLPKKVLLGVMYEPAKGGLLVKEVMPGSNAEQAGLKQGDLLLSLDGEKLTDSFDLMYAVQQKHQGDHAVMEVEREGRKVRVDVVFKAAGKTHPQ